ncbi:aldose 1-epimerase [Exophiala viscosa]|uniref:Glucose-6-phosphate 1-epimerase n=1 Tax=Exophiala viscosa TaxID=2486360 RepID=A0AAN6DVR9_9EURO|nr:aldose 1-epimerase [Exophiala viscosa]
MERKNRPASIPVSPSMAQPNVDLTDNVLTARLPSGDSVTVYLYGAHVTSWKTSNGQEQLFLSKAAALDGSKPIRGGIPLVFPVFGPPPKSHATGQLPQHGFARNSYWEFLGKNSSESLGRKSDDSVKLDFGLSNSMLDDGTRKKWPYEFGLVYSVTLSKGKLECQMHVQNKGSESFEFHVLLHTYLAIKDISKTAVKGLKSSPYVDKVREAKTFTEESSSLSFEGETDRVYTPPTGQGNSLVPLVVTEGGQESFVVTRDSLPDVTVWNGWVDKIKGMGDFEPKDGWKRYLCIEPGTVSSWTKLEAGDAWEGGAAYESKL